MLTRFVKTQLAIFTTVGIIGIVVMAISYVQVPTLLGIGRYEVTLQLPTSGGLYRFSNVTYRGVQIGKVTEVRSTRTGAEATLSLASSPKIPADLQAEVASVSAIGEQYVELKPRGDSGPYLHDGSIITAAQAEIPTPVGPVLDRVSKLVETFPKDRLSALLDETYKGFNGAGYDFGSLLDSGATLSAQLKGAADQTRTLADDARPLLEGQAATADPIRTWARSLAGFTGQVRANDPQLRAVLQRFPGFADQTSGLLSQLKPTLPILLANFGTVGEILMTYNASLEQLMVLLPPYIAQQQSYTVTSDSTGQARGDFASTVSDPPACTVGFLPPSSWRSPADESDIDTPDGLYCKLPQDSPISVRGVRNFPCIRHPGKRAPTVQICNSDKPFVPLAMREHATGPYPIDPSLVAQGIPIDDRTTFNDNIHAPVEGTPLPPGAVPSGTPPDAGQPVPVTNSPLEAPIADVAPPPPAPAPDAPPVPDGSALPVAPSGFGAANPDVKPTVAVAQYNPRTGEYVGSDGQLYKVTNLAADTPIDKTWKDMLPH
ncbi:virulence factor Mce-like protein [Mycobacterium sp. OAS707]|uniref:MCE family protein n=1 Tax=unclassified Mycobacterium TaxID=2642494 RepID=UPI00178C09B5|nr:MlaD family protein [Mycobacterium sp. OAS707]MBE1546746.1 virulence factor Mce-like protein [Mycobacterium sp. OAS707]